MSLLIAMLRQFLLACGRMQAHEGVSGHWRSVSVTALSTHLSGRQPAAAATWAVRPAQGAEARVRCMRCVNVRPGQGSREAGVLQSELTVATKMHLQAREAHCFTESQCAGRGRNSMQRRSVGPGAQTKAAHDRSDGTWHTLAHVLDAAPCSESGELRTCKQGLNGHGGHHWPRGGCPR